jgi:hypothetical protein
MMSTAPSRLTATDFYLPLLHVLANLSDYRPNVSVPLEEAYQGVLTLMGLNPDDYGVQESSGMPWVRRWVVWAFRNHQNKPHYEKKFNRGKPGTTTSPGRRQWALTPAGVAKARETRSQFPDYNWTSEWLGHELSTTDLYDRLHLHLSQKLAISAASMRISDHVQGFLTTAIANDKLAKDLQSGHPPSHRRLCEYAVRHAYSELRQDGQDGHMRGFYSASTARDRAVDQNGDLVPRDVSSFNLPVDTVAVSLVTDDLGNQSPATTGGGPLLDVADPNQDVEGTLLHNSALAASIERLTETLRARKPGAYGRYVDLLEAYRLGYTTKELAAAPTKERPLGQGVSLHRASTLWALMRRTLREAIAEGDLEDVRAMMFDTPEEDVLEAYRLGHLTSEDSEDALDMAVSIEDLEESRFFPGAAV